LALGPPAKAARILSLSDLPTPTIAVGSLAVSAQRPGFKLS
jgi:hypothetical protein